MKNRKRAFAAIINDGKIAMIHVKDGHREYWTLPGGGVEEGESFEETAIREAKEEVNLDIRIVRYLFEREYSAGTEYCYLSEAVDKLALKVGQDPELEPDKQRFVETQWVEVDKVRNDKQVSLVLNSLTEEEFIKYSIV
jgi:8-oxo-dGTP pyrophosphatase MutT (NUDIX family)